MDTLIIIVVWIWGAYKGWNIITGKNEWLDRKELVNYIVKGAVCVVFGAIFGVWTIIKVCFIIVNKFLQLMF